MGDLKMKLTKGRNETRLTEKKLKNRKFRKAEDAILEAFFEGDVYISTEEMARRAGVSRSTFYRHHKTVGLIVQDYENHVLKLYGRTISKALKEKLPLKQLFLRMLVFMSKHRVMLKILVMGGDRMVFMRMIGRLQPRIVTSMHLPQGAEKVFQVYVAEMVEILWRWGERGFDDEEIEAVLTDVMFLTETAKVRLGGLRR